MVDWMTEVNVTFIFYSCRCSVAINTQNVRQLLSIMRNTEYLAVTNIFFKFQCYVPMAAGSI